MQHRKDDRTVVSLTEVVNKAKAWEAANNINTRVMKAQNTDEQVNYTSTKKQQKLNSEQQLRKEQLCGYCGGREIHNKQTCPAG